MSFKLFIGTEIRRLSGADTKTYKDFQRKVESFLKTGSPTPVYKYLDVDNDWVSFSSEEEFSELLKNFHKDGVKIKVIIGEEKKEEKKEEKTSENRCPRTQGHCPRSQGQGQRFQGACHRWNKPQCERGQNHQDQWTDLLKMIQDPKNQQQINDTIGQFTNLGKEFLGEQGFQGLSELFKCPQGNSSEVVHRGVVCDGCEVSPIKGTRYRCNECPDFDLCEPCHTKKSHDSKHTFTQIAKPIGSRGFWEDFCGEIQKEAEKHAKKEETKPEVAKKEELVIEEVKEEPKEIYPQFVHVEVPAPVKKEEEAYPEQLELLKSMGFTNETLNSTLLKKWKGQIHRVVSDLLNQ